MDTHLFQYMAHDLPTNYKESLVYCQHINRYSTSRGCRSRYAHGCTTGRSQLDSDQQGKWSLKHIYSNYTVVQYQYFIRNLSDTRAHRRHKSDYRHKNDRRNAKKAMIRDFYGVNDRD